MRHPPPLNIPDHCQCSHDDPGMCSFCEWTREEDERDAHDEAFAEGELDRQRYEQLGREYYTKHPHG